MTVDLWLVATDALTTEVVTRLRTLMTPDEITRGDRFVRDVDRDTFTVARALVRTTLSRYAQTGPGDWRFVTNQFNCPFVEPSQAGDPPLHFNLSHTSGLVAVAVARGHRVGVDVERVTRVVSDGIAERHFAPEEVQDLAALPAERQAQTFFDYWTLKEAYIKARGMGLALPLDGFAFTLRGARPPTVAFKPGFDDNPARWQFWQSWPTPDHRLGLAVERQEQDLDIVVRQLEAASLAP